MWERDIRREKEIWRVAQLVYLDTRDLFIQPRAHVCTYHPERSRYAHHRPLQSKTSMTLSLRTRSPVKLEPQMLYG